MIPSCHDGNQPRDSSACTGPRKSWYIQSYPQAVFMMIVVVAGVDEFTGGSGGFHSVPQRSL